MTRKLTGAVAAGVFALGILTGSAGMIVVRDATAPSFDFTTVMADHMTNMGSMMNGSTMGGSMMGSPSASMMPGSLHDQHHPGLSR